MKIINSRKMLILPVILMALMMGFAGAYWHDQLVIEGEITTGTYDSELSLPKDQWGDNEVEKDIGQVSAIIIGPPYDIIEITITDAYPCYEAWVVIGVHHIGSVPCIISDISWVAPPELEIWIAEYATYPWPIGAQLHGCEEIFFYLYIHVFEDEMAEPPIEPLQDTTYAFTVTIETIQYNYFD